MMKVQEYKLIKIIRDRTTTTDRRQINLRSNTHGCELIINKKPSALRFVISACLFSRISIVGPFLSENESGGTEST